MNKKVDDYIKEKENWRNVLACLRKLLLSLSTEETIKWGAPVYTYDNKNIVGMSAFKNYVCLWIFQGGLLKDKKKKLINAQSGKTKAMRQWRFENEEAIVKDRELILTYVKEAIENQKAGKAIPRAKTAQVDIPQELADLLSNNPDLTAKLSKISPGKQRDYFRHINEAKRPATKEKRLKKIIELINAGKGLYDQYSK